MMSFAINITECRQHGFSFGIYKVIIHYKDSIEARFNMVFHTVCFFIVLLFLVESNAQNLNKLPLFPGLNH